MTGGNGNPPDSSPVAFTFGQFTEYLSKTHCADTQLDIDASVNKAVDRISARDDSTQTDLAAHKTTVAKDISEIRACIERLDNAQRAVPTPSDSYAAAAATAPQRSNRMLDLQSQEIRTFWQFRTV